LQNQQLTELPLNSRAVSTSPLAASPISSPAAVIRQLEAEGRAEVTSQQTPYHWAGGYLLTAVALLALYRFGSTPRHPPADTSEPA
jgi:hypothetical protein